MLLLLSEWAILISSRRRPVSSQTRRIIEVTKQKLLLVFLIVFALLSSSLVVPAQERAINSSARTSGGTAILPVGDLRPGMKGVARTVFSGTVPQDFGIEIIGVLPGFTGPRHSTIIARLSGTNVDKTGVFAGMSGSPVFIEDRLVGAIAYSFPFSKEPICGITPIQQMIDIFEQESQKQCGSRERSRSLSWRALNGNR